MILHPKVRVLLAALAATAIAACAVDQGTEQPLDGATGHVALHPLCTGTDHENACWLAVDGKPGCHIWIPEPGQGSMAFEGSANCANGKLTGDGNVTWRIRIDGEWESTAGEGRFVEGEMHGHWVLDFPDGSREEGLWVDDKKHGHWVETNPDRRREEGPYVHGKRHGRWVEMYPDGKRRWVATFTDGSRWEGPFVDREHPVEPSEDLNRREGPYVEGKRHGHWVFTKANGDREEGPYVDSERHGKWVFTKADGTRLEGPYVDGRKQGQWVTTYEDGRRQTVNY